MGELSMIVQGLSLGLTAAIAPGAFQSYLFAQTLMRGWRYGLPVALSPLLSDPPIVLTILLLLNRLPSYFLGGISLMGGGFVFYLTWGFWKQWKRSVRALPEEELLEEAHASNPLINTANGNWSALRRGALMNLLSPGVYTFWTLVLGPLVLQAFHRSMASGVFFLLGFYSAFIGALILLVGLFHEARRLGWRVVRSLRLLSLIILTIFGMLLLWQGTRLFIVLD